MKKQTIIDEITAMVGTNYSAWRIGLTHDPSKRKEEWKNEGMNVSAWAEWEADSLTDAEDIESKFIDLGMQGGTGGNLSSDEDVYVYIF